MGLQLGADGYGPLGWRRVRSPGSFPFSPLSPVSFLASFPARTHSVTDSLLPQIWSNTRDLDTWMTDAQAGIDSGSTWLAGFNEPDQDTQGALSPPSPPRWRLSFGRLFLPNVH